MTKEGSIKKRDDGRYELTEQGKEEMAWPPRIGSNLPRTIEDVLNEMNSFVSYFEDLAKSDPSKLTPHKEKIKELQSRLLKITNENKTA
jgi:DNA-binding PadR family transcriptional regulator